jgi:hypothetical protein
MLGSVFNISHYPTPLLNLKAIIKQAKTLQEIQSNHEVRETVYFYEKITENE